MKEGDIEVVKALVKVCRRLLHVGGSGFPPQTVTLLMFLLSLQEGCEGSENRLILHILTRPLCLFILAVCSSMLRCLVHSFILALAIPVFLLIVFLKITMPRSTGVLGSSRPSWDYVGSCCRETQDEVLHNPYGRPSGRTPVTKRVRLLTVLQKSFNFNMIYFSIVPEDQCNVYFTRTLNDAQPQQFTHHITGSLNNKLQYMYACIST